MIRWLTRALAAVGAGALLLMFYGRAVADPPDYVADPIVSPDHAFKAVRLSNMGGGGISPYCYERVAVVPNSAANTPAQAETATVFGANCDSFSLDAKCNCIEPSPKVEWMAANELRITFSINSTALFASAVKLRKLDASGTVHISFVVAK